MSAKHAKRKETVLYTFLRGVAWLVITLFIPTRYEGLENIPKDRGYILCSNHRCLLDPVFLGNKVPRQLHFMAKAELFKGKLAAWFLRTMGAFPVRRGGGDTHALDTAAQVVRDGDVMAIFPEGTRSRDGQPLPFHAGVAVVAGRTGADVLPAAVSFSGKMHIWKRVTIRYGKLIPNQALGLSAEATRSELRDATKMLSEKVVALTDLQSAK